MIVSVNVVCVCVWVCVGVIVIVNDCQCECCVCVCVCGCGFVGMGVDTYVIKHTYNPPHIYSNTACLLQTFLYQMHLVPHKLSTYITTFCSTLI